MDYKKYISKKINIDGISAEEIETLIITPPNQDLGDLALPCFKFSKSLRKSPQIIAESLMNNFVEDKFIKDVNAVAGYLNFKLSREGFSEAVIKEVIEKGDRYGSSEIGQNRVICIDYSSINIAKPFHIGHLSTTVIGGALYRIFNFLGYKAVGINHLGDWGTQFGKLISAYKRWGDKDKVSEGGIRELVKLYVKFHEEAEKDEGLNEEARAYFKKIEDGDAECLELFNWFKELTLKDVGKIYDLLSIKFDSYAGESFYNDKMQPVIDELERKNLLKDSQGAKVVDLEPYGMPPCLILKADGATLYATRDLAAAFYRKKTYNFYKCLYVVAYQQNLHFKQIFKVLELMGAEFYKDMEHVAYGMVSLEDGAMSTRKGNMVFLEDVIEKCIAKSYDIINEKNPDLDGKDEIAKMVGTGAVIFGALQNNKIKDIVFSYDKALNFDGETGVYVQYTCARCNSLLAKGGEIGDFTIESVTDEEFNLIKLIDSFKDIVLDASEKYEPSYITRLSIDIARSFNKFYYECKILGSEDNIKNYRLSLTKSALITMTNALGLLGISIPTRM